MFSYKFRLYPTKSQEELLSKHFGCCRFVYNYFLDKRINLYKEKRQNLSCFDNCNDLPRLKKEFEWLKEINSQSLQQSIRNLDKSYVNFFRRIKQNKPKKGFPKFKTKYNKQSYNIPQDIKVNDNKLYVCKFREGIKIVIDRKLQGKIKNCTISKNKAGQYFASLCCEYEITKLPQNNNKIGIDCNVKQIVCTDGKTFQKFDNPLPEHKHKKRLKLLAQSVSRKQKGSKSRAKAQLKLNKFRQYCKNVREDFLHKTSRRIINENQVIVVENLSVQEMVKKKGKKRKELRKVEQARFKLVNDCAFSSFLNKLEYKAKWYGREFIKINIFFASSKICSNCGQKNEELKSEKVWQCQKCFSFHNRDENASINILNEGLRIKTAGTAGLADCPSISPIIDRQLAESEVLIENSSKDA